MHLIGASAPETDERRAAIVEALRMADAATQYLMSFGSDSAVAAVYCDLSRNVHAVRVKVHTIIQEKVDKKRLRDAMDDNKDGVVVATAAQSPPPSPPSASVAMAPTSSSSSSVADTVAPLPPSQLQPQMQHSQSRIAEMTLNPRKMKKKAERDIASTT